MTSFLGKKEKVTLSVGLAYILVGVFLEFWIALFNVAWGVQNPATTSSFVLIIMGGLTLILYAPGNIRTVMRRASEEGLNVSDAEEKELLQVIRETRILLIGVLTAYTVFFILHIYYLDSIHFFPSSDFAVSYMGLLYVFPVFVVFPLVLAYLNIARRHRKVSHIYIRIGSTKSKKE